VGAARAPRPGAPRLRRALMAGPATARSGLAWLLVALFIVVRWSRST
jgi:hypothetical protein